MVVGVGARVVADRAAGVDARGEAEVGEQVERGVDRRQRDAGDVAVDALEDLLGRGVAADRLQRTVDGEPLGRDSQAALAQPRAEVGWVVQPGLIGLIDGTLSTLAPIFAAAYVSGSRAALLVGIAAALGAAISMGLSEALSDDGSLTGRGESVTRGLITGVATFVGGSAHALPFLISDVSTALTIAYAVVSVELVTIAWVRKRFLHVSMRLSLVQVTLGGIVISLVGVLLGHA